MRTELINSIDFTKEQYDEIARKKDLASFDEFIDEIIKSVKENEGGIEDAIFIANDAFSKI